jgi:membrane-associated phospholipid phosphatase
MSKKAKTAAMILAAIIAFALIEYIFYVAVDRQLALYASILEDTRPPLIKFFKRITDLGKSQWYLWPCGIATIFCAFLARGKDVAPRYRRLFSYVGVRTLFLFATIALSGIVADIIKPIVGRARPPLWLHDAVYGFKPFTHGFIWNSMPSGHATTAFALACSLAIFYPRLRILWFAYALLLAASRVMVDVHYLSDVVAGALLGWLTVRLFFKYGMIHAWQVIFPIDSPPPRT